MLISCGSGVVARFAREILLGFGVSGSCVILLFERRSCVHALSISWNEVGRVFFNKLGIDTRGNNR